MSVQGSRDASETQLRASAAGFLHWLHVVSRSVVSENKGEAQFSSFRSYAYSTST